MRRLVRHGLAGVGAATFAVVAGVTALGAPTSTLAVPAPSTVARPVTAPLDPQAEALRAATAERENREAERTRIGAAAGMAALRRASDLDAQSAAIGKRSDEIKVARAEAAQVAAARSRAAAKARADARSRSAARAAAKVAKAKAKAAKKRAAAKAQGYQPGETDPKVIARQILENRFGYGADQFSCFSWIISRESNWDVHARNASSGAYGLPQSLPGSKMASVAPDWRTNPATQIIWGAKYMKTRYGSPCGAKAHWESAGNY